MKKKISKFLGFQLEIENGTMCSGNYWQSVAANRSKYSVTHGRQVFPHSKSYISQVSLLQQEQKLKVTFRMGKEPVDTEIFRHGVWNYAHCRLGIM